MGFKQFTKQERAGLKKALKRYLIKGYMSNEALTAALKEEGIKGPHGTELNVAAVSYYVTMVRKSLGVSGLRSWPSQEVTANTTQVSTDDKPSKVASGRKAALDWVLEDKEISDKAKLELVRSFVKYI